jgi:S1-C subfamily serine protease
VTRRIPVLAALLALALLVGCGGSDAPGIGGDQDGSSEDGVRTLSDTSSQRQRVIVQTSSDGFNPAEVYREAAPGVVTIRSILGNGAAEGSGFVLDDRGRIVTNAHVITDETGVERAEAESVFVEFPDRNVVSAEIIGFDPFSDIALIQVDPEGLDLHPIALGDERDIVVGQPVAAIGSPFGEQHSLSVGIVSAIGRSVESLTDFSIEGAIQTDASINPGNSGGPLLDAAAEVIGVNQQIQTETGASDGVGFAIPVSVVKRSAEQLIDEGEVEYAYIGVSTQALYPQLAERLDLEVDYGGLLAEVVPDGPADEAGLRGGDGKARFQGFPFSTGGDVILSIEDHKVVRPEDLARQIAIREPGDVVTIEILRDGDFQEVDVTLEERPDAVPGG